ncbi:MAG: ATP-binding protein [Brumimicrobium sp.]
MKELFKQIILERQEWIREIDVVPRDISIEKNANYVFTGLRRAGKTYFLYQIIKYLVQNDDYELILFVNFEDERLLEVSSDHLHLLIEAYYELFDKKPILFLDEIQTVENWQKFIRRIADDGYSIYVTGSNANMFSAEIATTLGGRFFTKEILPLSFKEFLQFQSISFTLKSKYTEERFVLKRAHKNYLKFGGFPELLKFEHKREYLSSVYQKLFYGDLVARYNISNVNVLKLLVKKLAESVNNETAVNRIKNLIKSTGLSIGNNTLFDYLNYLEASFMIASISNYHSKFVEKETKKKYYFLDTGVLMLFLHDQDTKLLENQIYIELRRRGYDVYFLKRKKEIDFYIPEENLLIQVSYSMQNPETKNREVNALVSGMKELNITQSLIITMDETDEINMDAGNIQIIPAWKWLIQEVKDA